jgi:alkylhydroperoxidase family enzyme
MSEHIGRLRAVVADTPPPPEAMAPYLAEVRAGAYAIGDADVERLKAAGLTEDEIFEQTVAAAIGEGLRRLDAALEAIG